MPKKKTEVEKEVLTDEVIKKKVKKPRKKKELTDEQRKAIGERLQKARKKKDPNIGVKNVHPNVLALPDDDDMSLVNVKEWILESKKLVSEYNKQSRARGLTEKQRTALTSKASAKQAYIRWLEHYIKTGDWIGDYIGKNEDTSINRKCLAMAYDKDGKPKRTVGVFYEDILCIWTRDMELGKEEPPISYYDEPITEDI